MAYNEVHDEGIGCSVEADACNFKNWGQDYVVQLSTYGPRSGFGKGHLESVAAITAADARDLRDRINEILTALGEQ